VRASTSAGEAVRGPSARRVRRVGGPVPGLHSLARTVRAAMSPIARRRPDIREGVLYPGLPYLAFGGGPPIVVLTGLSAEHTKPTGASGDWPA
jgi:hypothetical protein